MPLTPRSNVEKHLSYRAGWLRAAVLGANDGILSTASLVLGVAASGAGRAAIVTAGIAGLVAGATSMAAGEYVSVSSQRDTERADLALELRELDAMPEVERDELAAIYRARGVSPEVADRVAEELSAGDRLRAHARDELGIDPDRLARPFQAAWASAISFAVGAAVPLIAIALAPAGARIVVAIVVTLVALSALGFAGARLGGAPPLQAIRRVVLGGVFAMAVTMGIGALVGTAV
ncbi:MAG: vacuolar iron transporter family protein [Gaiellaceae bacterium]|nr:vacuolar iron transporter family protein [Gaiellaceae bacterium]